MTDSVNRYIEIRLVHENGAIDPWDAEWFTEEEAIDHLAENFKPEWPPWALDDGFRESVYDAPWDHPEIHWITDAMEPRTRVRVMRVS